MTSHDMTSHDTSHDPSAHGTGPAPLVGPLTARCPEDLLAFVPVALGFVPRRSVVLLTFGSGPTFHARVDLPTGERESRLVVEALLDPCLRHDVERVVLVLYADTPGSVRDLADRLEAALAGEGIEVLEVLCADGARWSSMLPGHGDGHAVPYDVSSHRFAAEAVVAGLVTHASREELSASLDAHPPAVAAVRAVLAAATPAPGEWVRALARRHVPRGSVPGPDDLARLLLSLHDPVAREGAWCEITRADARDHVAWWTTVLRAAPTDLAAGPASVLAFAAWLAGHGALAWCAVERALEVDPGCSLAGTVSDLLVAAVPPSLWRAPGWPPDLGAAHASGGAA